MLKLVECVPNFSEGLDQAKITAIADEIRSTEDVTLLDVDPGKNTNRTVITFIGSPSGVLEAAFRAIAKASEVIDMSKHHGEHARMGATDVCPFVPVTGVTMEDCVELAKQLGKRVGDELLIPVYLYEEAATKPERKNLAFIRAGEYEGFEKKMTDPEWQPDFGPVKFNTKSGATAIGAREFLIAYNINLNTRDVKKAKEIAFTIRENGRLKRDPKGQVVRDKEGNALRIPGKFKACKAVGWYMEDFGRAQISMNLVNYKITPPQCVFDECCKLAQSLGVRVTGSELVGLIPLEAMRQAGKHYLHKQGRTPGVSEPELIHTAVLSLGLNDLYPFDPEKKIIEYKVKKPSVLSSMKIRDFNDLLSSEIPAPGGGSVAALCGAMGCALSSMVATLTYGKQGYEKFFDTMGKIGTTAQKLKDELLADVDRDTEAFNQLMDALRLPKKTDKEITIRNKAIEQATRQAILVPMNVMEKSLHAIKLAWQVSEEGNQNSISDAGVAALAARTAAEGAYLNVCINLPGMKDQKFKQDTYKKAGTLRSEAVRLAEDIINSIENKLKKTKEP